MSRAFRICVRENLRKLVRAEDHISTQLELLPILPQAELAQLLALELQNRGFSRVGEQWTRTEKRVTITVDPATATVTVHGAGHEDVALSEEALGFALSQRGAAAEKVRDALRKEARESLQTRAAMTEQALQAEVTAELEAEVEKLAQELNQIVNRVTAEALKRKAAQLGSIKDIAEDPQSGSLTIVLEV